MTKEREQNGYNEVPWQPNPPQQNHDCSSTTPTLQSLELKQFVIVVIVYDVSFVVVVVSGLGMLRGERWVKGLGEKKRDFVVVGKVSGAGGISTLKNKTEKKKKKKNKAAGKGMKHKE